MEENQIKESKESCFTSTLGSYAIKVGALTAIAASVVCLYKFTMPGSYKIEKQRGAEIIYNDAGDVFVKNNPENMLQYLINEDRDNLRHAFRNLEDKLHSYDTRGD